MALRANQSFTVGLATGQVRYEKDQIVPAHIAKGRDGLVYDDTIPVPPAEPYVRRPRVVDPAPVDEPKGRRGRKTTDDPVVE